MPIFGGPPNIEKLKAKRNIRDLIKALSYTSDRDVQSAASAALAEIGQTEPIEGLIACRG